MAPKKDKTKEEKANDKARQKERDNRAADKTFGLKNKNKSKVVQQHVKAMTMSAKAASMQGKPKNEVEEKKEKQKSAQQQALLAGLFNMATDKKGRAFDPTAKKKAKEKNMEEERSGANMPDELQHV